MGEGGPPAGCEIVDLEPGLPEGSSLQPTGEPKPPRGNRLGWRNRTEDGSQRKPSEEAPEGQEMGHLAAKPADRTNGEKGRRTFFDS